MYPSVPSEWTAALVLRGLRLAYAAEPRLDEASTSAHPSTSAQPPALFRFIVERARDVLGEDSPEYVALVLRCSRSMRVAPAAGLSIREMCRERYGWAGSRSELYRRSNNGAARLAAALTEDGIKPPSE